MNGSSRTRIASFSDDVISSRNVRTYLYIFFFPLKKNSFCVNNLDQQRNDIETDPQYIYMCTTIFSIFAFCAGKPLSLSQQVTRVLASVPRVMWGSDTYCMKRAHCVLAREFSLSLSLIAVL